MNHAMIRLLFVASRLSIATKHNMDVLRSIQYVWMHYFEVYLFEVGFVSRQQTVVLFEAGTLSCAKYLVIWCSPLHSRHRKSRLLRLPALPHDESVNVIFVRHRGNEVLTVSPLETELPGPALFLMEMHTRVLRCSIARRYHPNLLPHNNIMIGNPCWCRARRTGDYHAPSQPAQYVADSLHVVKTHAALCCGTFCRGSPKGAKATTMSVGVTSSLFKRLHRVPG